MLTCLNRQVTLPNVAINTGGDMLTTGQLINVFKKMDEVLLSLNGCLHRLGVAEKRQLINALVSDYPCHKERIFANQLVQEAVQSMHVHFAGTIDYFHLSRAVNRITIAQWAVVRHTIEDLWADYILNYADEKYSDPWKQLIARYQTRYQAA